ncbi:MAG TPA: DUF423 domain-containing protein [Gemmatimonadota bacterium]
MNGRWISTGALLAALAVTAGAFGAHALAARLTPEALALWETGVRYLMYGALGVICAGLGSARGPERLWTLSAACLATGSIVFSGTLGAMALGGPRWLGAVTPLGGALLIAGFVALAAAALRR